MAGTAMKTRVIQGLTRINKIVPKKEEGLWVGRWVCRYGFGVMLMQSSCVGNEIPI